MPNQYGRRPPKNAPALSLGPLLTGVVPEHPASEDYLKTLTGWQMLGNDSAGDCNAVTWANTRRLVTAYLSSENYPTQDQVWQFYKTQNPQFDPNGSSDTDGPGSSADKGMDIQTGLEYLHANGGPDGVQAVAFAKVDPSNLAETEAALAIFGSLWLGIVVLKANQQEFNSHAPWTDVLGSDIDARHAIVGGGYTSDDPTSVDIDFITWATETEFAPSFWNGSVQGTRLVEEAWVVIWPEHLNSQEFLQGVNLDQLKADYQALTGQALTVPPPPPVITSAATAGGKVGKAFSYRIKATNSPSSFGATGLPAGLSVNSSTGIISGTSAAAGTFSVQLSAINAAGTGTAPLALSVTTPVSGEPPALVARSAQPAQLDFPAAWVPPPVSPTPPPPPAPPAPEQPTLADIGRQLQEIGRQLLGAGVPFAVSHVTQQPVITTATTAGGKAGKPFSYRIKATAHPSSFGATGLPAGLSVNSSTGIISGTPSSPGIFSVHLSATNAAGTGTATLALTVKPAPQPPVITSATAAGGTAGKAFSYRIKATNSSSSFGATGLPAGLSVNSSTGIISGTPSSPGIFSVHLSATNAAGTGTATLALSVKVGALPVITSAATAGGKVGKAFSYRIKATNSPSSFGATGLPAGLSVNSSTGIISGTSAAAGTFSVQLSAINAAGTGTAPLALSVTTPVSGEPPALVARSALPAQLDFPAAWVPPPVSPTPPPPPAPPVPEQPTLADIGRQLQEIGAQLHGASGSPLNTGIVAASGIVMQGLLTLQAMTDGTSNPNGGGTNRS